MNWKQLAAVANQRVLNGIGSARVCLDKRGLDLLQPEIELTLPPDGGNSCANSFGADCVRLERSTERISGHKK